MRDIDTIIKDFRSKFVGIREADDIEMIPTSIRPEKIEKWLRAVLEEREKPKENERGYIVEGGVCHFCKGTGKSGSQNVLC